MIDIFNFKKYSKRKGDSTEAKIGHVNYALEQIGNSKPYKEYVAHITQSGANPPTAVIMQNDFDTIPVWSRFESGLYNLTFSETISQAKCFVTITNYNYLRYNNYLDYLGAGYSNSFSIFVTTGWQIKNTGIVEEPSDGVLYKHVIMVRIYN